MIINSKIKTWGNGSGIRLSKEIMAGLDVKIDDDIQIEIKDKQMIVTARKMETLEEMFEGFTGTPESYLYPEDLKVWQNAEPKGNELWK